MQECGPRYLYAAFIVLEYDSSEWIAISPMLSRENIFVIAYFCLRVLVIWLEKAGIRCRIVNYAMSLLNMWAC